MASSSQLKAERSKYYSFLDNVSNLAKKILESYNVYSTASQHVENMYKVNGDPADGGKCKASCESLSDSYNLLVNTTIPAINNKIDNLNSKIRAAERAEEEAEEEERRRREEEKERKKALKSSKS